MSWGDAIGDADELLTLIALLPVMVGVLVMAQNLGNPEYDMVGQFEAVINTFAHALVPSIGAIVVVGTLLYFARMDW